MSRPKCGISHAFQVQLGAIRKEAMSHVTTNYYLSAMAICGCQRPKDERAMMMPLPRNFVLFSAVVATLFTGALLITKLYYTTAHGFDIWYVRLVVISRPIIALTLIFSYVSLYFGLLKASLRVYRLPQKVMWLQSHFRVLVMFTTPIVGIVSLMPIVKSPYLASEMLPALADVLRWSTLVVGLLTGELWCWRIAHTRSDMNWLKMV